MTCFSKVPDLMENSSAKDIEIQEVEDLMKIKLPNLYKN